MEQEGRLARRGHKASEAQRDRKANRVHRGAQGCRAGAEA